MKHKMTQFTIYIDDIELAKYCSCGLIDWVSISLITNTLKKDPFDGQERMVQEGVPCYGGGSRIV